MFIFVEYTFITMKKFYLSALASVVMMACSNHAEEALITDTEIRLTSKIAPSRVTALDYQSTEIAVGQQVGITIAGAQREHRNVAWNVGKDGRLTHTGNPVFWGDERITITAYHPYNAGCVGTSYAFSVHKDQSINSGYLDSDLLWATETASITDNPIGLTFTHKLSKINVTLTSEDIADLSRAQIFICGTCISTEFNPVSGSFSATASNMSEIKAGVTTDNAYTASAIIIPQKVLQGTPLIRIAHENKEYLYTLPEDVEFKTGHSYRYSLKIMQNNGDVKMTGSDYTGGWN